MIVVSCAIGAYAIQNAMFDIWLMLGSRHGLGVGIAFGAAAAALVGHDDRLLDQFVFGNDALDCTGEIIRAASGTGRRDELDRLDGLPRGICGGQADGETERGRSDRRLYRH